MFIVEEPFVSDLTVAYLEEAGHPVLGNATARRIAAQGRCLNLVDDAACARAVEAGERLYTNSESALRWVASHVPDAPAARAAALFKDKARMRALLAPLSPGVAFRELPAAELREMSFEDLPQPPFVLKPTVGFCSVGVHVVADRAGWDAAVADIEARFAEQRRRYPDSVVGDRSFLVESYIAGREFAIDAYYDEDGRAHVLDVLRHEFASPDDTSDRLYATGSSVMRAWAARFAAWLDEVNAFVGARSFPMHAEVRVADDGTILPVEFNPLRFAGMCGTDVAQFAYGFLTYDCFLRGAEPDWNEALARAEGKLVCMCLLPAPATLPAGASFDAERFSAGFDDMRGFYAFDPQRTGAFGFAFCATDEEGARGADERHRLLTEDLSRYVVAARE